MSTESLADSAREHGFVRTLVPRGRAELVEAVQGLAKTGESFCPTGHGSRLGWGAPYGDCPVLLSTSRLDRVTRLAPADLTCGVEPGTRLGTLLTTVSAHGLTLEPGPFPPERSIGGLLAEGALSARGFDRGSLRSQLIGIAAVDGRGREFKAGGNVVKNVAGYDLPKLFVGSGGAYFVAVELQLRLTHRPEVARWLGSEELSRTEATSLWRQTRARCVDARAVDLVLESNGAGRVEVLLAGSAALVESLAAQPGLAARDGEDAWLGAPETVEPTGEEVVVRGRVWPSAVAELAGSLPDGGRGRVHLQGAFTLHLPAFTPEAFPAGTIVRPIRNGPVAAPSTIALAERLKATFGGNLCPGRTAFDTGCAR